MKDITKEFLAQPINYRSKPNLNVRRVDMYASKMQNIYRVLGAKTLLLKVQFGHTITRRIPADARTAVQVIRAYGDIYFLEFTYANTKDSITIKLTGMAPKKKKSEKSDE